MHSGNKTQIFQLHSTKVNKKNNLHEKIINEAEKLFAKKGFSGT